MGLILKSILFNQTGCHCPANGYIVLYANNSNGPRISTDHRGFTYRYIEILRLVYIFTKKMELETLLHMVLVPKNI